MITLNDCFQYGYNEMKDVPYPNWIDAIHNYFSNCSCLLEKSGYELEKYFKNEYDNGLLEYLYEYFYSTFHEYMEDMPSDESFISISDYDDLYGGGWEKYWEGAENYSTVWLQDPANIEKMSNYFVSNIKDIVKTNEA